MTALLADVRFRNPDQQQLLKEIRLNSQSMEDDFFRLVSYTYIPARAGSNNLLRKTEELLETQLLIRSRKADSIASTLQSQVDNDIRNTQTREITLILLVLGLTTAPVVVVLIRMRKRITAPPLLSSVKGPKSSAPVTWTMSSPWSARMKSEI